jgi:hypothetical protein
MSAAASIAAVRRLACGHDCPRWQGAGMGTKSTVCRRLL